MPDTQQLDPAAIAAKYGGVPVDTSETGVPRDPAAIAAKYGGVPVSTLEASGPPPAARGFTIPESVRVTNPPPPAPPVRSAKTGGGRAPAPPLGQGFPEAIPLVGTGLLQAGGGLHTLFDLASTPQPAAAGSVTDRALNAGSDVLEGGAKALTPLLGVGLVSAPLQTGAALLAAWGGAKAGEKGVQAAGGSPAAARFSGNLAALLAGGLAGYATDRAATSSAESAGAAAEADGVARAKAAAVLGVDPHAGPEAVQSAYRAAARANHPDLGGDAATMADINLAYTWLQDHPSPIGPAVTAAAWVKQQLDWLRAQFPSRASAAADRAAQAPPEPYVQPPPEGRLLTTAPGEAAPTPAEAVEGPVPAAAEAAAIAERFGGVPAEPSGVEPVAKPEVEAPPRKVAAAKGTEGTPGLPELVKGSILSQLDAAHREALASALGGFGGGNQRWNELRLRGATNQQILAQAGQEFGLGGGSSSGAGEDHKGGKNPQLILGARGGGAGIKLNGPKLAATIREALGIPAPVQTIGGQPVAPERPVGFWDLNPDELQARIGFDITKPWETGPNATSTPEQLDAFHDKLIDNVLSTVQEKGAAALPEVNKLLRSVEHLRDTSHPSDYGYAWDAAPFIRTIPELERIVKRLEGQQDLPIARPEGEPGGEPEQLAPRGPGAASGGAEAAPAAEKASRKALPEELTDTRDYADVQAWAARESARTGQPVEAVLKAHDLPATAEAFAHWIYPAKPGTPVPGARNKPVIKEPGKDTAAEAPTRAPTAAAPAFKAGDRVRADEGLGTVYRVAEGSLKIALEPDGHLSNWIPLRRVRLIKEATGPVPLTDAEHVAGGKKLRALERKYGIESTRATRQVREANTAAALSNALEQVEAEFKADKEKRDAEAAKKQAAVQAGIDKAIQKGRELVAAGKPVVWRSLQFAGQKRSVWVPMEGSAVTIAGAPAGMTFSAFKDDEEKDFRKRWLVVENSTGFTIAYPGATRKQAIKNAEDVAKTITPEKWAAAIEKGRGVVGQKPDLTAAPELETHFGHKTTPATASQSPIAVAIQAGREAFESGHPREVPTEFTGNEANAWRGAWDKAAKVQAVVTKHGGTPVEKSPEEFDAAARGVPYDQMTKRELKELLDIGVGEEPQKAAKELERRQTEETNPESRYAGDQIKDLLPQVEKEQRQRFESMLAIEQAIDARPDQQHGKSVADLKRQLQELRDVYQGTYSEVADAAGHQAMNDLQDRVEAGQISLADEILNPPRQKGEPHNEEERLAARQAAAEGLPARAYHAIYRALHKSDIRNPFPQGAVEFRTWMAEQLKVPVTDLTADIDVINDAAEAALAAWLRQWNLADEDDELFARAQALEKLLPRAHRTLEKSKLQQFSTPLPIGLLAGDAARLTKNDRVLEPTAGTGSLLAGVPRTITVHAVELAPRRVALLKAAGVDVTEGDYLTTRQKPAPTVIISNPPWGKYSTGKYGRGVAMGFGPSDVAERFVGKMLRDLADGGRLVAVMPTTMLNAPSFKSWLRANFTVQAIIQAPPGAYDTRSTGVDSLLLVVDKVKPPIAAGTALGPPLPATLVTADWKAYRSAVEAIPERAGHPAAAVEPRSPGRTPRAGAEPRPGGRTGAEPAVSRSEQPEPRRNPAVGSERPPDVVADEREPGGAPSQPDGEFAARVSGPSADARAAARRSESFAPYPRRTALRGLGHPKLVVEARQLAGVEYPPLTYQPHSAIKDALAQGRVSVEQAEQALAAVQANLVQHHGYLAADAVGVGKSREIALTILEAMQAAKADDRELRLIVTTKSADNIADLIDREMYYVATGRTRDGSDLANPGAAKEPPGGLPFRVEIVTDRKNAKKFGTKEYEPLPLHPRGIYVIDSYNLAAYEGALEDINAHGVVGDEAHRFKNIEGAAVGGAWQRLHARILRGVARPEQFFAYFTATPAQAVEDYAYLYGLRLWPVDGFPDWLQLVTGALDEKGAAKLAADTEKGAKNIDRVIGSTGDEVVGGDAEDVSGGRKGKGGITNRSAFDARLTPTEGEQIPREWKMLGRFSARDLWRDGTEFQIHEAKLPTKHLQKYDQFVTLAQDIIESAGKYGALDKSGKAARFGVTGLLQFAAKRIQLQPAIEEAIRLAQAEVKQGHQVVLSLINVSEMNDERGHLQAAIDKINTRIVDRDPDDPDGGFQDLGEIPEAIVDQGRLRDQVRDLGTFDDPLKLVEDAVGAEHVAFITGQTGATRQSQIADFQAGKRDYAVLSAAGATGINLDHRVFTTKLPGRGRRVFIDVQYEWSATEALQRYGRVDRASSISPPKIIALTFGNASEKKFLATIANRMAALGALSKGGAESTGGASALEEFEITGDDALAAARKAYEELPEAGKKQFARVKSVFRDPNRETRPDRGSYDPYQPKPSASGTTMQDFQLPLLFMPIADSNAFWSRFITLRDEFREASGQARSTRTERFTGEILRTTQLKPNLTLYEVKNSANQKFGILAGLVTPELPKLRTALGSGEYDPTTGSYERGLTRRYVTFTAGDQVATGLQVRWSKVKAVAELYEHSLTGETLDTPEKVLGALKAGEHLPLQEKNPDSGKPWTLRLRSDEKIAVDHARMADRAMLLRYGADYAPVGNYWHVKDLAKFLERFPLAEASTTTKPKPKPPSSSAGGTTLQATVVPGAAEFVEQDVLPGLEAAGKQLAAVAQQLRQGLAPTSLPAGQQAAGSLRAMMAREAQENARMQKAATAFQTQFNKLLATPGGQDQAIDWWDAVQTGQPTKILPELKAAYDYMRGALDAERIEVQQYGKLEDFNAFYFPQIWKFPKQEAAWIRRKLAGLLGKRPFEGSKSFLKKRTYPTFREGLDALRPKGIEPISYNPVDHFLIKMREMRRYRVARAAIRDFEQMGIWKAVRGGARAPEGWTRIDGPLGTIYGPPTVAFKEAFDPDLFEGLEKFARGIGVKLARQPNIGGRRWGYAQGGHFVMTKAAGPEGVLMHEIGHILDERYGLRTMVKDKTFKQELRDLADLRHEGTPKERVPPGRLRYERKGEEKIANLVHAFLYAPERAKKIAPNSYWALFNLAKQHAELRPLLKLQKTRSLKLGTRVHTLDIGGFPEMGFYAMPDDAARVFNNHLSRGLAGQSAIYDAYRWLNNTMVTGQLAASGLFHATFTGLNALASEGALVLQELTRAAQTGDWALAKRGAARLGTASALGAAGAVAGFALGGPAGVLWASGYPLAAAKFIKGWRAQREWLTKDPGGRFFNDYVRQMNEGGFRPTWDQFYDNGAMKHALEALKRGNYPGALLRAVPAAVDALSRPIMAWLVPGVKTAAFLDAAGFELQGLQKEISAVEDAEAELANWPPPGKGRAGLTPEERGDLAQLEALRADNLAVIRAALNRVQTSIDNRFGEVVYDNWFWKRWLKDLAHVTLRSPGWQAGTYKELGAALTQQARALAGAAQAKRAGQPHDEDLLAGPMAYWLALLGMTMILGGLSHYLSTGEKPHGRDWIFPKGPDGQRRAMPTYIRTIFSAYLHPVRTVGSITAPLNTLLYRLLIANETYSGEMIREPGDPFLKQAWDALRLAASEGYQPFVLGNVKRGLGKAESAMGVAPAAAEIQRSAAANYLHDVLPPSPTRTHEEQAHVEATRALREGIQQQNPTGIKGAIAEGGLSRRSILTAARNASRSSLLRSFEAATLPQALHAYALAEPEERATLKGPLARKWSRLISTSKPADRPALVQQFRAALALPTTTPATAAGR